ncbi:cytochrome P450 2K1-like [Mugil cephalus]|uniref:cytochrome P450 2K1-like n=1 Tax=Mugil cephalus TaxID=48193 RepID=UPI001FB76EC4|nr:cytochrome P450 2K1-like [Mugil cephalus]
MDLLEFVLHSSSFLFLLGSLVVIFFVYLISSSGFASQTTLKEPPGPKPLPLLGNLLQLDLKRLHSTLLELSKKYGSVFTIYMGPKKVVVLAGYKTVKEALVNCADEFGERGQFHILEEFMHGNGIIWSNGESWKDLRRFTMTNLRDFGMGKKECENKIIEESRYLIEVLKNFNGEGFDTLQTINYAVANIICSITYGHRFEYDDVEFTSLVDRTCRNNELLGTASVQLYNLFPWIGKLFSLHKEYAKSFAAHRKHNLKLLSHLKATLNPQMCRGFVDAFLVHKQKLETSFVFLLGSLVVVFFVYLISSSGFASQTTLKEPPGPKPLPLLGNLLQLDLKRLHSTLLEFSKKYGSVFTIYMGPKKVVVLAGYKTVKEALVNCADEFGERGQLHILEEFMHGNGIIWSNGESWKDLRRFIMTNLRDFGMGKKECENKIIEESRYLIEVLKKLNGEGFDTLQTINYAVANILCSIIFGHRFEYDDVEFISLIDRTCRNNELLGTPSVQLYNLFPCIGKLFSLHKEYAKSFAAHRKHNLKLLSHLKATLNPQMCRGFVDAFLVHKQKLEKSGITNSPFHDENLLITVINLLVGGTDTTSTTLRWALLFMAKYPKIQDQVQDELTRVIGSRQVELKDRKEVPFTNAVIHETQRLASIALLSLPHRTNKDVTFRGHFIKKGTTVYPLLFSVLHDESEWERPHSFHPAHFLDKDGKFVKPDAFMPFSAGRRICIGESLARMELFVFFTTLLQHFRFTPPPGVSEDDLDLTPRVGFSLNPSPHKLCAVSLM